METSRKPQSNVGGRPVGAKTGPVALKMRKLLEARLLEWLTLGIPRIGADGCVLMQDGKPVTRTINAAEAGQILKYLDFMAPELMKWLKDREHDRFLRAVQERVAAGDSAFAAADESRAA